MRNILGRLLILVAEALDRNLVTVPEIDEYDSRSVGLQLHAHMPTSAIASKRASAQHNRETA
jgi:hypothetical protein